MSDEPGDGAAGKVGTDLSTGDGGQPDGFVDNYSTLSHSELSDCEPSDSEPTVAGPSTSGPDLARQALAQARAMSSPGGTVAQAQSQRDARKRNRNRTANLGRREWSGARDDDRDPQPVGSVLKRLLDERGWHKELTVARLFADWPALVGEDIAAHCTPVELREGHLKLSAASSAWATQLRLLAPTLLARLSTQLGAGVVIAVSVTGPSGPSWKHGRRSVPGARGPRDTYG